MSDTSPHILPDKIWQQYEILASERRSTLGLRILGLTVVLGVVIAGLGGFQRVTSQKALSR